MLWRLRYKLSLRDLTELFLERGFVFTHEAVRDWEARFVPLIADQLRRKRRSQIATSCYVNETYIKVHGKWCYVYRAIDRDGNLVDSMVSEKRNMDAAKRFFLQAVATIGQAPLLVMPRPPCLSNSRVGKERASLYRWLDEPDVTFEALVQPHQQQTRERMQAEHVVLAVQDTTELDLSHRGKMTGIGQIGNAQGRGSTCKPCWWWNPRPRPFSHELRNEIVAELNLI